MRSSAVTRAKETWEYSKNHANILTKMLKNWQSLTPVSVSRFDVLHLRYREEIYSLSQIMKVEGPIYRPTGYGLGVMLLLSVPGSMKFASLCAKAYHFLRCVYLKNPEKPSIQLSEFRQHLAIEDALSEQVLYILSDINVCNQPTEGENPPVYVSASIRDNADIWAVLEIIVPTYARQRLLPHGTPPFSSPNASFMPTDFSHNVIGMCPGALGDLQKAHDRLLHDPAGAITSARSMLESAIKWIHHQKQEEQPSKDASTGRRLKDCLKLLGGAENDFDKPGIRIMVSGMETAVNGLDAARNAMSDGHGKSPDAPPANPRIARLVVGLATTVTTFLLATYESRQRP
ncbi:abortive infection family protein [Collimonas sp. H4R21]|uniref:Abortive infection family protein n=1 Tax=Collimonas rhizosphaerae TaxID=3126357 RepID=A0ABU9PTC5_9BURK